MPPRYEASAEPATPCDLPAESAAAAERPSEYWVPLSLLVLDAGTGAAVRTVRVVLEGAEPLRVAVAQGEVLKVNHGHTAVCRVEYAAADLARLLAPACFGALPAMDRLGLALDLIAVAQARPPAIAAVLALLAALRDSGEAHPGVWGPILEFLGPLLARLEAAAALPAALPGFLRGCLAPLRAACGDLRRAVAPEAYTARAVDPDTKRELLLTLLRCGDGELRAQLCELGRRLLEAVAAGASPAVAAADVLGDAAALLGPALTAVVQTADSAEAAVAACESLLPLAACGDEPVALECWSAMLRTHHLPAAVHALDCFVETGRPATQLFELASNLVRCPLAVRALYRTKCCAAPAEPADGGGEPEECNTARAVVEELVWYALHLNESLADPDALRPRAAHGTRAQKLFARVSSNALVARGCTRGAIERFLDAHGS